MNTTLRLLLYIPLVLGFLNSCVSIAPAPYPAAWEKPATSIDNIEQRIVGDYSCEGKTLRPSNFEVIDAGFLPHSLQMNVDVKCDTVRFRQVKEGELEITLLSDGNAIETKSFLAGADYSTDNGWLVIDWSEGGSEREGFMAIGAYATGSNSFTLDMSGNLIVKESFSAAGMMIFVPFAGYGSTWEMYERQSN